MSYENSRALNAIQEISELISLESETDKLTQRCKFNFHYFDSNNAGQDFLAWNHSQLVNLLNKLKNYSESPLSYWQNQSTGSGHQNILEIYGHFPIKRKTDFKEPKFIPVDVEWGRFRLGSKIRLIGFVIPNSLHDKAHNITGERFDKNTFYIVFLDSQHKFYKTENK